MLRKIVSYWAVLLLCVGITVTDAQQKSLKWVNIFPIGGKVYNLVVDPHDPNSVYASTYKGVFKSINGGNLWMPVWLAPSGVERSVIKFDPVNVRIIYIGTSTGKLLRSMDSGKTWEDIAGIVKGGIYDIAIHPTSPEIIYVASAQGLFKTLNGGKTWGTIWSGKDDYSRRTGRVQALQVFLNLESPQEVYAIFSHFVGSGLYYSKNGGENFNSITPKSVTTFIEDIFGGKTREIEIEGISYASLNPNNPQELFTVTSARWAGAFSYSFLLKSSNKGQSWQILMDKTEVKALAFHADNKDVIYAIIADEEKGGHPDTQKLGDKILKSMDGGKKWIPLTTPYSQEISDIAKLHSDKRNLYLNISGIELAFAGSLYVATNYGIYKTKNDGKSWEPRSFGLPTPSRRILWVDVHKKSIYVRDKLGYEGGYWVSDVDGIIWKWHFGPSDKETKGKYYISSEVSQLIMDSEKTTYVVTGQGVFKLTSSGKYSMLKIPFPPPYSSITLYTSSNPKILYAAGKAWAANSILLKSEDGGFSWVEIDWKKWLLSERLGTGRWNGMNMLAVDPQSPNILYITVGPEDKRRALFKTTDGGNTWTEIDINVIPESVVIDPSNSNVVYLLDRYSLMRSNDGGKTWKSIKPNANYIYDIAVHPLSHNILCLATDKGIFRSSDFGEIWRSLNSGLLDPAIKRVIVSPHMLLAEGENGIYKLMSQF